LYDVIFILSFTLLFLLLLAAKPQKGPQPLRTAALHITLCGAAIKSVHLLVAYPAPPALPVRESRSVVPTGIPSLCLSVAVEVIMFLALSAYTNKYLIAFEAN
jgi:hypothetical protein